MSKTEEQLVPDESVIRKIRVARYLLSLAESHLKDTSDLAVFAGTHLLQDAVELFLVATAEHLHATTTSNMKFEAYMDAIEQKVGNALPYRPKLLRLNRIRVESKHHGGQPPRDECKTLLTPVKEFCLDVSDQYIGVNFNTVSLVDILNAGEIKQFLKQAEVALTERDYETCLVECRKALFTEFELAYDLAMHLGSANSLHRVMMILSGRGAKVSHFARNEKFIKDHVTNPTDYIYIDRDQVERDLLVLGVDSQAFWNVCRLTPPVYKPQDKKAQWIIKRDFALVDEDTVKPNAEYVFPTTVEIMIAVHQSRQKVKPRSSQTFHVNVRDEAPIYRDADKTSAVTGYVPKGMLKVDTDFSVSGLDGTQYYFVRILTKDHQAFDGYIDESDVKLQ
jgi:hypothetical protein